MFYVPSAEQQGLRHWKVERSLELPLEFDGHLLGIWRQDRGGGWYTDHYIFQTQGGKYVHSQRKITFEWGDRNVRTLAFVYSTKAALFANCSLPPSALGAFGWAQHIA